MIFLLLMSSTLSLNISTFLRSHLFFFHALSFVYNIDLSSFIRPSNHFLGISNINYSLNDLLHLFQYISILTFLSLLSSTSLCLLLSLSISLFASIYGYFWCIYTEILCPWRCQSTTNPLDPMRLNEFVTLGALWWITGKINREWPWQSRVE